MSTAVWDRPLRCLAPLAIAGLLACGGGGSQGPTVALAGVNAYISMDETPLFTATVSGGGSQAVTWSLVEGAAAGTLEAGGKYHPGTTAGTYHVKAASVSDPSRSATAAFQLVAPPAIDAFTVDRGSVRAGESAQLAFQFRGGDGAIAGVGPVTSGVPVTVSPAATTSYTLVVQNLAGRTTAATVTVNFAALGGSFSALASAFPVNVYAHGASLLGSGQVLITGGCQVTGVTPLGAVYTLDPATGVTLALNGIVKGRMNHQQLPLDGTRVLLVGGSENYNANTSTLVYDTAGGGSAAAVNVPYGFVWDCQGAPLKDGRIFLYEEGDNLIYAPATDTTSAKGTFAGDYRAFHTMTTLADGKVLLVGGAQARIGVNPPPTLDSAALYDPAANTLEKLTARLSTPRKAHTATLLGDGTVLIVGGLGDSGGGLATAELYDPQTRSFSAPIPLNYGRYAGFTATRLQDGNVLIAGRTTASNPGSQGVCEIYSVAQKKFLATGALVRTRNSHTATLLPTGRVLFVGGNGAETASGQALTEVFIP